jgi:hypothetical protein
MNVFGPNPAENGHSLLFLLVYALELESNRIEFLGGKATIGGLVEAKTKPRLSAFVRRNECTWHFASLIGVPQENGYSLFTFFFFFWFICVGQKGRKSSYEVGDEMNKWRKRDLAYAIDEDFLGFARPWLFNCGCGENDAKPFCF